MTPQATQRLIVAAALVAGLLVAIVVIAGAVVTISNKHDLSFGQYVEDLTILGGAIAVAVGAAVGLLVRK